jgi:hypothetical protein
MCEWFSAFFENAFVSLVMRRFPIRIERFWRSENDVLMCFGVHSYLLLEASCHCPIGYRNMADR